MFILRLILVSLTLISLSCTSTTKTGSITNKSSSYSDTIRASFNNETMWWVYTDSVKIDMNNSANTFFKNWTADTSGFEFRQPYIKFFTDGNNGSKFLTGMKRTDVIQLMGKPNRQNSGEGYITVVEYYMEWGCGNPEYDCCWLTIFFDDGDKVKEVSVACT